MDSQFSESDAEALLPITRRVQRGQLVRRRRCSCICVQRRAQPTESAIAFLQQAVLSRFCAGLVLTNLRPILLQLQVLALQLQHARFLVLNLAAHRVAMRWRRLLPQRCCATALGTQQLAVAPRKALLSRGRPAVFNAVELGGGAGGVGGAPALRASVLKCLYNSTKRNVDLWRYPTRVCPAFRTGARRRRWLSAPA